MVAAEPDNLAAWTNWGRLLHEQGELHKSLEIYEQGVARAGADAVLLFNRGVLLEDLGDAASALESYQRALEEDPDFADCVALNCARTWGLRLVNSTNIFVYAAGLYNFFENWNGLEQLTP